MNENKAEPRLPSPRACRRCDNYRGGRGDKLCLKCNNYKLLDQIYDIRNTINVIPMVQAVVENIPMPARPDNHLMQMVRELPASDAALISLHYYGALSVREIAHVMQISQEATSRRLYRAVSHLKKNITQQLPEVKTKIDAKMSHLLSPIDI